MILRKVSIAIAVSLLTATMFAQSSKLAGNWEGKMERQGEHAGESAPVSFEFHANGESLTGTMTVRGRLFGEISDAKVEGSKIAFKVKGVAVQGTVDGDQLKLAATDDKGEQTDITASRKAQAQ
jgi:hypothetical protein